MQSWSSEKYKVIRVDNNDFMLGHPTKRKMFLRHETRTLNEFYIKGINKYIYIYIYIHA